MTFLTAVTTVNSNIFVLLSSLEGFYHCINYFKMDRAEKENETRNSDGERNASSIDSIVGNMALAHEIVMDKNFRIHEPSADSIEGQVKRIVHKAFWDNLEEEMLKDPPNYAHTIKLLAELKETLLSLVLNHTNLKDQVNNVLDLDLISQQSEQGSVDIEGYAAYIIDVMGKICMPARDEDIEKLKEVKGLVPLLREIFHVLDLMKLDMANFQLSMFRPELLQRSIGYEQEKFREYLKANPNGLLSTKQWIKRGIDNVHVEVNQSKKDDNCEDLDTKDGSCGVQSETSVAGASGLQSLRKSPPEILEVVKQSYVGILLGEGAFPYPETLLMDRHRVAEMRKSTQCLVRVASILVVTLNIVGKHLASDSEYKKTLKETVHILLRGVSESNLADVFPNICEHVTKETQSFLSMRGLASMDEEKLSLLRQQILNLAQDDHSVRQLMKKRLYTFMVKNLLRPQTSSPLEQFPTAFLDVETELVELTKQFANLISHNYAVFKPFYEQVIQELPVVP